MFSKHFVFNCILVKNVHYTKKLLFINKTKNNTINGLGHCYG